MWKKITTYSKPASMHAITRNLTVLLSSIAQIAETALQNPLSVLLTWAGVSLMMIPMALMEASLSTIMMLFSEDGGAALKNEEMKAELRKACDKAVSVDEKAEVSAA